MEISKVIALCADWMRGGGIFYDESQVCPMGLAGPWGVGTPANRNASKVSDLRSRVCRWMQGPDETVHTASIESVVV